MRLSTTKAVLLLLALLAAACRPTAREPPAAVPNPTPAPARPEVSADLLRRAAGAVRPLHRRMGPVRPGDWLTHTDEPGQTFEEYLREGPVRADAGRHVIYVQPLGDFNPAQRRVVALAAEFLSHFFQLPVRVRPERPLDDLPASALRVHPTWGDVQIQAGHLLNLLRPALPADAVAMIGFTAEDLYPDENFNFIFGQASLSDRVGVWSLYRLGDPGAGPGGFRLTLRRTLKVAAHETGHMFSIRHCTSYECVMCGSNHLAETDRRPLEACPECMAKICWATQGDPRERYERLAAFCAAHGLDAERRFYESALAALRKT